MVARCGTLAVILAWALALAAEESSPRDKPSRPTSTDQVAGVGMALRQENDGLSVAAIVSGSPAEESEKLHVGDRIVSVSEDGGEAVEVSGKTVVDVVSLIRGHAGTRIGITVIPKGKDEADQFRVTLTRRALGELNLFGDGIFLARWTQAPDFTSMTLPDGMAQKLSDRAGKIVVVEFWASWCAPCLKRVDELSEQVAAHPEWKNRIEFIAVSADDDQPTAKAAWEKRNWSGLSAAWAGRDVLKLYHIDAIPAVYVIDSKGRVVAGGIDIDLNEILPAQLGQSPSP